MSPIVGVVPEYPFPRHRAGVLVTVLRFAAGDEDVHGNPVASWSEFAVLENCAFDPGSTSEPRLAGQDRVVVEPTLYASFDAPVEPQDHVLVNGVEYEVEGVPRRWSSPFSGTAYGSVMTLRRVTG